MVILGIFYGCMVAQGGSDRWVELIKDMRSTNAAALAEGHVDYDIEIRPRKSLGEKPVRLQAELDWNGPRFLIKYRFYSEYAPVLGETRTVPIELAKWTLFLRNDSEQLIYNAETKVFHVYESNFSMNSFLRLTPPDLWGRCCPPLHAARSWSDMLDLVVIEGEESSKATISVQGDERVRYDRLDPNGFKVSISYSLKQGGNVEEVSSVGKDGAYHKYSARFSWAPSGGAWVLSSAEIDSYDPNSPAERMQISIKASNCSLVNKNKMMFDRESVMSLRPEAIRLIDHRNNKSIRLDRPPAVAGARLGELAEKLRTRGFAKKP